MGTQSMPDRTSKSLNNKLVYISSNRFVFKSDFILSPIHTYIYICGEEGFCVVMFFFFWLLRYDFDLYGLTY